MSKVDPRAEKVNGRAGAISMRYAEYCLFTLSVLLPQMLHAKCSMVSQHQNNKRGHKHKMLPQCLFNVGPGSSNE